jgi:hydrogenase nickel incorporation protein HypA/HybF
MHELAITQSVVDMVIDKTTGRRVCVVRVEVGALSGVVPEAMAFCFDVAATGTPIEGATLEITVVEGRAHCRTCEQDFTLDTLILLCPCGSADVAVVQGQELRITSVDLEAAEPCA